MSHELKTPLTSIYAISELMSGGMVKPEDVADFSKKISFQADRLINIIEHIIRLSEFDESKVEKDFTTFDIFSLAQSVITSLHDKASEKSITAQLTGQPMEIKANRLLIDEMLYNLIDNGIKYNNIGGNVTIHISQESNWCKISVSDTGMGIPQKHQERVFERFYRVDASRSKKTGGTGLGLSIVKHIVEHHRGEIFLDSVEGEGTVIICKLRIDN